MDTKGAIKWYNCIVFIFNEYFVSQNANIFQDLKISNADISFVWIKIVIEVCGKTKVFRIKKKEL